MPSLYHNLLSLGQLSEKGYDLHFKYGDGTISDEKLGLIAKVKMNRSRLWPLSLNCGDLPCFNSVTCDDSWLWHMRFGHLNFGSLKFLAKKKFVIGLPSVEFLDKKCESCILGKKHRDPFPKGKAWRANRPLELIHSDLCSVEVPSNGGSKYFITFIDDFSRKTWVYFLKNKSDACDVFKKFKYYVEKQSDYFIKILRTDRGTEYLVCDDYLVESGIKHQLTARYTPQQNGVAERKNRTVMDMVRSMMHSKGIPKSLWAEAVSCAIYVLNRCSTRCNFGKTPQEV